MMVLLLLQIKYYGFVQITPEEFGNEPFLSVRPPFIIIPSRIKATQLGKWIVCNQWQFWCHRLNYNNLWVYRNLSRHATWHQRSYQIILNQGNQNPQNNMIESSSFASTARVTQWSNYLTQRAEILTRRSNLTPQRAKNIVNTVNVLSVVSGTEVAFDIKQIGYTISSLFFHETSKLQSAVHSEWKQFWLTLHCCWIHWEKKMISRSRTWSSAGVLPEKLAGGVRPACPKPLPYLWPKSA